MMSRPRFTRRWAWGGILLWIAAQAIPVDRDNPPVRSEIAAPDSIMTILRRSCYDCHSNATRWPWYSYVAPLSWVVASHVRDGRGDLNFSEWPRLDFELQALALHDIETQISGGKMPLRSYTLVHHGALLSDTDRTALIRWARRR